MRAMRHPHALRPRLRAIGLALLMLLSALAPAAPTHAITGPVTVDLVATGDARTQAGSPDVGFGGGFIWTGTANGHRAFVQFDLLAIPAGATISSAELRLSYTGTYTGTASVEVGRSDAAWDEATITWNTQPPITFNSNTQPVGDAAAIIVWPVTGLVGQWHSGAQPNYGFGLRGDGLLKAFHSRETGAGAPPTLRVTYTPPPEEGPRPDLGDAPDSTNSLGVSPNTAYPGVPGQFPTVWAGTPAGQPAGPRHANPTIEGVLGSALSREVEADSGNDSDGRNNILDGGADRADEDRADEGWRNPLAPFPHCGTTTLRVRVTRAPGASLDRMFLNVWFDGNRSGAWGDRDLCTPEDSALAIPAYEWVVQNYYVDMTGIAPGSSVDIDIPTTTILNTTPGQRHWMRFTLSDERAVESARGRADGRGPHPSAGSFGFGETEDVLQRPQQPGEPGTLQLSKRVVTDGEPVEWIDYVTYEIRLRHDGGSQPIEARIRDTLPYPLIVYPTIVSGQIEYVQVTSATGGVAPLAAALEVIPPNGTTPPQQQIRWSGSLAPNAELVLTFQVRVIALCEPNQQTMTFTNRAEARPRGGAIISAEDTFTAKCIDYDDEGIEFEMHPLDDLTSLDDLTQVPWGAEIWNSHPFTTTIGLYQGGVSQITQDNTTDLIGALTLGPNERRDITISLPVEQGDASPLDAGGDPAPIRVGFCLLIPDSDRCPDPAEFPQLHGEAPPLSVAGRSNDLGDAPDSTNHAGAAMLAYPGTPAAFPTVFDPATGLPQGPRHVSPRLLHLGERVSREREADLGADQDPQNNILPATNNPDNDRGDDGARLVGLADCQPATAEVKVLITPQAAAWFQQNGRSAYLNTWVDSNRNGAWGDIRPCGGGVDGGQAAVEHILIDYPIDVAALGAGLHTLSIPTGLVPWPAALASQPAWVRFTLSERESSKPLQSGPVRHGDGRGFDIPFRTGETEDYLIRPDEAPAPDLSIGLGGEITGDDGQHQTALSVEVANLGSLTATGATLDITKPTQLAGARLTLLRAPGIADDQVVEADATVTISLPDMPPGATRRILLAWEAPADQAPAGDYAASVAAQLAADPRPEDNQASLTLARPFDLPTIAVLAGEGNIWGAAETTCRTEVDLAGVSIPGALFSLWVDGAHEAGLQDLDSTWNYRLSGLADGRHELWLTPNVVSPTTRSNILRLNVDTTLPVDPLSLTFTDSQGRSYHPATLSWRRMERELAAFLQPGETYEIGIDSCGSSPNQQIELVSPDGSQISLTDPDGDGRYTGALVFDESGSIDSESFSRAAARMAVVALRLIVQSGGARQELGITIQPPTGGVAIDAVSGQPLAGVSITAVGGGGPLPAGAVGQPNPATSGQDGRYALAPSGGPMRLIAARSGYQTYRTWDLAGQSATPTLPLTPEIAGTPALVVAITADGFEPALAQIPQGAVVEWVNLDVVEHSVSGGGIESGALAPGDRYRAVVRAGGRISITDAADPLSDGALIVDGATIFLPLVVR